MGTLQVYQQKIGSAEVNKLRPVSLSTTYASVVELNAGSIEDPSETIQALVEFVQQWQMVPVGLKDLASVAAFWR